MNLPNKLSVMRILLVPLIVILYLLPQHTDILHEQLALASFTFDLRDLLVLALFAIASFTDFLDGHIARKHSLITSLKACRPIADKLPVDSLLICSRRISGSASPR
ncbi:MAG: CDP-alcohol phosphatidyltransferase family protein [Merdibacter sp.]